MWRCPICEKEHMQGLVCEDCGFDLSCDYEQNRTLCSALPKHVEPISVRTAKWREQQRESEQAPAPRQKSISRKKLLGITGMCAIMALVVAVCMMQQSDQSRTTNQYGNGSPTATPEPTQNSTPASKDVVTGGKAGPSVTWTVSDTGMLTISGRGKMYDVDFGDSPWDSRRDQITSVVVESGVTKYRQVRILYVHQPDRHYAAGGCIRNR